MLFKIVCSYERSIGSQTLIDHIFTTDTHTKSEVVKSILSEYYAQIATLNVVCKSIEIKVKVSAERCFIRSSVDTFNILLTCANWDEVYMSEYVEQKFHFQEKLILKKLLLIKSNTKKELLKRNPPSNLQRIY